jgi:hypothetical protein
MVTAVVIEAEPTTAGNYLRKFEASQPVKVRHHWGEAMLLQDTSISRVVPLKGANGRPLPSVFKLYEDKHKKVFGGGAPQADDVRELADWCLTVGLMKQFTEVMDRLVELQKTSPVAVAYARVRDELKKPVTQGETSDWLSRLPRDFTAARKPGSHYAVLYGNGATAAEADKALEALEHGLQGFYYWWALRGDVLPVPRQEMVALVASPEDFKQYKKGLTPAPVVADALFARREGLTLMSAVRTDDAYDGLKKLSERWWRTGFKRDQVLLGKKGASAIPVGAQLEDIIEAQTMAIALKAMEVDRDRTAATHEATRQLLFATGLLPRNVVVPEWVLFGTAAFFESPLNTPWPSVGAPSFEWLPLFKEYRTTRYERSAADTLQHVITDGYFRAIPQGSDPASRRGRHGAELRARAAAWSLMYYLAREKREGLLPYFQELSRMPRDMELDNGRLLGAFARAFRCADADGKPDAPQMARLANDWYRYMEHTLLVSEPAQRDMRQAVRQMEMDINSRRRQREARPQGPGGPGRPGPGNAGGGGGGGGSG